MREILFRGKDVAGNWHYGVPLVFTDDYVCMTAPHTYNKKVEANTMGQYTGVNDKNGTKVFEGDVIWGDDCTGTWHKGVVEYDDSIGSFIINAKRFMQYPKNENHYDLLGCWSIEGNIHDNPELLEGGNE